MIKNYMHNRRLDEIISRNIREMINEGINGGMEVTPKEMKQLNSIIKKVEKFNAELEDWKREYGEYELAELDDESTRIVYPAVISEINEENKFGYLVTFNEVMVGLRDTKIKDEYEVVVEYVEDEDEGEMIREIRADNGDDDIIETIKYFKRMLKKAKAIWASDNPDAVAENYSDEE